MANLTNGMTIKLGQISQIGLNKNDNQQNQTFIFEEHLDRLLPQQEGINDPFAAPSRVDHKRNTVVCTYWLRGVCQRGEDCQYLHRLDQSKSAPCPNGVDCKKKICHLKHVSIDDIPECTFYKQGFCYNGNKCQRRHAKRTQDECPVGNEKFDAAAQGGAIQNPQSNKKIKSSQRNENYKVSLCEQWLKGLPCVYNETCNFAHGEEDINEASLQSNEIIADIDIYDPTRNVLDMENEPQLPWLANAKTSYFMCQAPNLRSLKISKERGVWSIPARFAADMNSAFRATQHVVIFFCVRSLKGVYGVAKMLSSIPPLPSNPPPLTSEFQVQWLRTMRVSLRTIAQLKTGNTQMFIGRTPTDCWFDSNTGLMIMMVCFRKPLWDWTKDKVIIRAQGTRDPSDEIPSSALFTDSWIEKVRELSRQSICKDWYSLDLPGFVFTEYGPFKDEMLFKNLFGLPGDMKMKGVTQSIHPGAPLFMYDSAQGLMHGIYMSSSVTLDNLDPTAFIDPASYYMTGSMVSLRPIQVRVEATLETQPISIYDNEFKVIFPQGPKLCALDLKETKLLSNLFAIRAGLLSPTTTSSRPTTTSNTQTEGGTQTTQYKSLSFANVVPIDIQGPLPAIKKGLLGNNASVIKDLVNEVSGDDSRLVRVRMRGINSGFNEGPLHQELQEPLHFDVSADNKELLTTATQAVQALVNRVRCDVQRGF